MSEVTGKKTKGEIGDEIESWGQGGEMIERRKSRVLVFGKEEERIQTKRFIGKIIEVR